MSVDNRQLKPNIFHKCNRPEVIFGHFPIEIPIEVDKKLPTWEGKVLERKQKQF